MFFIVRQGLSSFTILLPSWSNSSFYLQWGGACVIAFLFVYFVIPETKGLSLEQGESSSDSEKKTRTIN